VRIGILTGGGDVPGLNPCIKAVVDRVIDDGHEVVGSGAAGPACSSTTSTTRGIERALRDRRSSQDVVRTIDRTGGTFLHTSRTNPQRVRDKEVPRFLRDRGARRGPARLHRPHAAKVLDHLGSTR
jgi:ATP-dependent phosphofructokinase / diphosphate-dependent phosphofructokinase